MRNGKVYWIKQKFVGLLLIIGPLLFIDIIIECDAAIVLPIYWLLGILMIKEKSRITCMFKSDYIFDVRLFVRILRRKIRRKRLRSGRL